MRNLPFVFLAACAGAPLESISDDAITTTGTHAAGGGTVAVRLGHRVELEVGFNNRRLGDDANWTLAHPDEFDADVARLAPGMLRFPGGTIGQYYDWNGATGAAAGTLFQSGTTCPGPIDPNQLYWQPVLPITKVHDPIGDTLDTLAAETPLGTRVDFMLDMIVRASWGEIGMLDAAAANGFAIDRVELGNEFYYAGTSTDGTCDVFANAYPTAAHYATVANAWGRRVAARYPHARIAAVANERFDDAACDGTARHRFECWNHDLLAAGVDPSIGALAIHPYVWHAGTCASGADMYDDADSLLGAAMQMGNALFAAKRGADRSRGLMRESLGAWSGPIWITEYGYFNYAERGRDWSRSWAAGLGVLAYALRLTADPRVEVLLHHNITDALWPVGNSAGKSGRSARGLALAQLDAALAEARPTANDDVWKLDFDATPAQYDVAAACGYDATGPFQYRALLGRWFTHGYDRHGTRGSSGIVVNLGARDVEIDVRDLYGAAGAQADVWWAATDAEPDDVVAPLHHASHALDAAHHTLTLPARSITHFHDLGGTARPGEMPLAR